VQSAAGNEDPSPIPLQSVTADEIQILSIPARLRRADREIRMLIDATDPFTMAKPDARLIKLLVRAHRFNTTLSPPNEPGVGARPAGVVALIE
jgi:hypothetical protein